MFIEGREKEKSSKNKRMFSLFPPSSTYMYVRMIRKQMVPVILDLEVFQQPFSSIYVF